MVYAEQIHVKVNIYDVTDVKQNEIIVRIDCRTVVFLNVGQMCIKGSLNKTISL